MYHVALFKFMLLMYLRPRLYSAMQLISIRNIYRFTYLVEHIKSSMVAQRFRFSSPAPILLAHSLTSVFALAAPYASATAGVLQALVAAKRTYRKKKKKQGPARLPLPPGSQQAAKLGPLLARRASSLSLYHTCTIHTP